MTHTPVLIKEVLEYLAIKPNENVIDGTIGQAGHTLLILEKNGPKGKVLGIDQDKGQIENSRKTTERFKDRVVLVHDSYSNIKQILGKNDVVPISGILLDLGYSSWQLEASKKGFSFLKDEVLDMRYDQKIALTAQAIVNEYSELGIEKILEEYGEEKFAKKIAKKIVEERKRKKIESTFELIGIIQQALPKRSKPDHIHFATRTFQALRIAVNDELGNLAKALPDALACLAPDGRLVVISFHSLEDRIVKNFFKEQEQLKNVTILTKKPVIATDQEVLENPRARSAKLRAITKT